MYLPVPPLLPSISPPHLTSVSDDMKFYLKGKSLNYFDDYQPGAEELLSRAVKLNPLNADAWIVLGQCHWKKNSLQQAEIFFLESLKYLKGEGEQREGMAQEEGRGKEILIVAYQELSMLTRQMITTDKDSASQRIDESISYIKKALQLDLNDHKSWYLYGNALCMKFFRLTSNSSDLQKALTAYQKSLSLGGGTCNPDLFYNQGNCYRYLQEYHQAISCYQQTIQLDPSFTLANECAEDVIGYLQKTREMVGKKGGFQKKRFQKILDKLRSSTHAEHSETMTSLQEGPNLNKRISVCLLGVATKSSMPPESFLCVDKEGNCAILAIYNLGHDTPPPSPDQIFTVSNPVYRRSMVPPSTVVPGMQGTEREDEVQIPLIQAFRLDQLQINGRTVSWRALATPELSVDLFGS
jgi:tetratricopeptide (TPR) repeat protein